MLEIIVSNSSASPIYEQIAQQIKEAILTGDLAELEAAGFVNTVQGKGTFVSGGNIELLREEQLRNVEQLLSQATELAKSAGVDARELHEMLDLLMED